MGQKLQETFFIFFLFASIFLAWGGISVTSAQISLDSNSPLEVQFAEGNSLRQETSLTVGLSDIESIFSPEFVLNKKEWELYNNVESTGSNYYISESNSPAAGRMQIEGLPYQTYFLSSVLNNTDHSIGNLVIAFDFIYNFYEMSQNPTLALKYKVAEEEWKSVRNGVIEKGHLRSVEDAWSSFSLHINLNDIYLRKSDMIHLMWVIDEDEPVTEKIPLALQRMGIYPEKVDQNPLKEGDLIITEILPSTDVNGSKFEYIEIYNPGENPVPLKGVELTSPLGSKVIQQEIFAEPYDFMIISNVDISSLENVDNSYFYNGSILDRNGSRIELEREGNLIASATYETSEPGTALELNRVSNAYDGYSSLQDFAPSQLSYFQDLYGSPGVRGSTSPMLGKKLTDRGFYILSVPGHIIQRLNRYSSVEFYSLDGELLDFESIDPYETVLVHKRNDQPVTVYVEDEISQNPSLDLSSYMTPKTGFVPAVLNEASNNTSNTSVQAIPITQTWNQKQQKFRLQLSDQVRHDYWTPLVINSKVADLMGNSESRLAAPRLERFVQFALTPGDENQQSTSDAVMLGFMDSNAQQPELRYDLPKLTLSLPSWSDQKRNSSLYLTSTLSEENYNSFTHLPYEIDQEYEVGLGLHITDNEGSGILKWKIEDQIPDEWVITIEDTYNGTILNLKEENEYRFRYNSSGLSEVENSSEDDTPKVTTVTPSDRPRFIVKVQPYESYSTQVQESETPDSIELRPNYPNPFNPSTNINFFLPEERDVRVGIYNIVGQQVALLLDDTVQQGEHSLVWDASDKPSGIYIVQLETGNRIFTRKITLIK